MIINAEAVDRQEKPTLEKQSSLSKRSLSRVIKARLRRAGDYDECDRTTGTNVTSSSFFFTAPTKSCLKQTRTKGTTSNTKKVTFDSLDVHEHAILLGDNPSVSSGPPLTISWEAQASVHLSIDEYEASRPPRRHKEEMHVPREIREDWLRQAGYARSHFAEVNKMILKTKKERAASAKGTLMDVMVHKLKRGQSSTEAFSNILPRTLSGG